MNRCAPILAGLMLAAGFGSAIGASDSAAMRARAIENCKSSRGVDCNSAEGLREWIELERKRPPGQRSPVMQQKLEAERRAQQPAK
jgi:hypothetical protein